MGVCGSRTAAGKSPPPPPARALSNWKVDDSHAAAATASDVQLCVSSGSDTLALNCVASHTSLAETQTCVTGWEDGAIRSLRWGNEGGVALDAATAVAAVWKPHERAVNRVVVGSSGALLYSCSRDTTVALTPLITPPLSPSQEQPPLVRLRGHSLNVATIAVNDAETTLCSGGRDTLTVFWDLRTGKLKAKNTTSQNVVTCSKWVPSEPLVVQGSEDLTLKLWDERTMLRTPAQTFHGYVYFALSVDVSPDATYLLTSSKGFNGVGCEVRVWDRRSSRQLHEFVGHQQDTTSCCFLPASAAAPTGVDASNSALPIPATASKDGTVKVWDAVTSSVLCEIPEPTGGMFTSMCAVSSSTLLASTFGGAVHAFEFDASNASLHRIGS